MSTLSNARRPLATAHRLIREGNAEAFRGYLHQLYETDMLGLEEAGEMLHEYTCKQDAEFAKQLCETAAPDEQALSLVRFLTDHFFPRFALTAENRRLLQRVYLLYKNLAVAVYEALNTRQSGQAAYTACRKYADFQDPASTVGRLSVITARTRAVEIMEALAKSDNDRMLHMELADAYRGMTAYHMHSTDKKSIDSALLYGRKAMELSGRLYAQSPAPDTAALLAAAQEDVAQLLENTVMRRQAEPLYEKALELRKRTAETEQTPEAALAYALVCGKLAQLHTVCKGTGRRDRALALYLQEAELLKALSADTDPALQQEFARCRSALADLYADSDKVKDCIAAFEHYKAAAAVYMRVMQTAPCEAVAMDYARCRYCMALTLYRVGGDNNLNTALGILGELNTAQATYPALSPYEGKLLFLTYALEERLWLHHPLERRHPEFHPAYEHALGCGEILEILGYLPSDYREQLSCRERSTLRMDALPFYTKHINPKIPLKQQELTKTAADWVTEFMKQVKS